MTATRQLKATAKDGIYNLQRVYTIILILFALTLLDLIVVETVYRPTQDWTNIWKYHLIYWTLIIAVPLIVSYKQKDWTPLLTYILFFFGIEDTLFYLLQGVLPPLYYGVSFVGIIYQPSLPFGLIINTFGVGLTILCLAQQ